jgi:two-component system response regulator AtoC
MHEVMQIVRRVARFNTTVLITGESGTGKELISREIHRLSARHDTPFIAINCGAIPENLLESELFGHKKGAFTDASRDKRGLFEEANGGTLFLDEIGELPLHLQVKLLRALQERQIRRVGDEELIPIDVRLIAATLRNLEVDIQEGRFRDDLYYRLNVVTLNLPPLRERREEIPVLVKHLLQKLNARLKTRVKEVGEKAMQIFITYPWPGNVRELENCIERMMVLSDEEILDISMLPKSLKNFFGGKDGDLGVVEHIVLDNLSIKSKTKELEIALIEKALNAYKRNRTKAASVLEISHRALLYKMKEYNNS